MFKACGGGRRSPCCISHEDKNKVATKSGLTLPCHHAVCAISVISCHVISYHVPHHLEDYGNSILEKCNVKWNSKRHLCNVKIHIGSQRVTENSNIH